MTLGDVNTVDFASKEHSTLALSKCSTNESTLKVNAILQLRMTLVGRDEPAPIVSIADSNFVHLIRLLRASKSLMVVMVAPVSITKLIDAISSKNGDDNSVGV